MKFAIGDKVVEKKNVGAHSSYPVSQVAGLLNGALLLTPWGDGYNGELHHDDFYDEDKPGTRAWREGIQRHTEDDLLTPEEALVEIHKLEAASSKLNEEFAAVKDQIEAKLDQAAKLADEAAVMILKHKKSFEDLTHECVPLYQALKKGGWRHSTLQCKVG